MLSLHSVPRVSYAHENARSRLGYFMFFSRWIQAPLYLGLIVAQVVYVWRFMLELKHLIMLGFGGYAAETTIMLIVLALVDVVMISNLLIMVIIGGYETFVSRLRIEGHPDQPQWLSHVNANVLKVKLAMAIIGISSIHLLQIFINAGRPAVTDRELLWKTLIHLTFILSAVALALIDRFMQGGRPEHAGGSRGVAEQAAGSQDRRIA
ncbi:TIGR00645 family protein [Spongiactinospora sp. TRM90649]|uniref:TIGR00645 family protein n=1 Tax=Spongiactinospora sp. TRM90649 TaxID=3031114 RepID=UPI0023F99102|nr:TIGR00645 family protein [Spongiactinospora sp. TRM90649]MDF5756448.1 TIGR00645 family protein [Spongiactinospora sp. TRM90649]